MDNILLDSVIVIDHFNGVAAATAYLKKTEGFCAISVITRAEVLTGFDAGQAERALPLLNRFPVFEIDVPTADRAAELRRAHRWRLPDAFQAAIAQLHQIKLATRNSRDFPPEQFDFVIIPYSI